MKTLSIIALTTLLFTASLSAATLNQIRSSNLTVKGMVCSSCSTAVKKALSALPGVGEITVDIKKDLVTVTYDQQKTTLQQMVDAVKKAGFQAEIPK